MIYWYTFLYVIIFFLAVPWLVAGIIFSKRFRENLHERISVYPGYKKDKLRNTKKKLWIHAASVGEVKLIRTLPNLLNRSDVLITCLTPEGRHQARKIFKKATVVLIPLDITFLYKKLLSYVNPGKLIIMETELWPGLIYSASEMDTIILNGRLSVKKFPVYKIFRGFISNMLNRIEAIYPKDRTNRNRYLNLGISAAKIKEPLNLKYIFNIPGDKSEQLRDNRFHLPDNPVLVCGSTHSGEEKIILEVYSKIRCKFKNLSLIISPRHLNRVSRVIKLIEKYNFKPNLWSKKNKKINPGEVVIVDTIGELEKIYSLASVAFVGGSLIPHGGQNVIEPAIYKTPVVIGPYYHNFKDIVLDLKETGGISVVNSKLEFRRNIAKILSNPRQYSKRGNRLYQNLMQKRRLNMNKLGKIL